MYDPIVMNLLRKAFQISDNYVLIKEQYISSQKFTFKKERSKLELLKKQLYQKTSVLVFLLNQGFSNCVPRRHI